MALVLNEPNVESFLGLATSRAHSPPLCLVLCALRHTRVHACTCACVSRPITSSPVPPGPAFRTSSFLVPFHGVPSRLSRKHREKNIGSIARKLYTVQGGTSIFENCSRPVERTNIRSILATIAAFSIPLMYSNALYTTCKLYTSRVS